jgi:hypothetical protein
MAIKTPPAPVVPVVVGDAIGVPEGCEMAVVGPHEASTPATRTREPNLLISFETQRITE